MIKEIKNNKTIIIISHDNKDFEKTTNVSEEKGQKEPTLDLIKDKKISDKFTFDRGGYMYLGRIKELAMGIRSKGIKF